MLAPRAPLIDRPAVQQIFATSRGQPRSLSRKSRVAVTARFDSNRGDQCIADLLIGPVQLPELA